MAYQCPPPAFTLCRVTSVIGSTPIKSLLNLIAPIFPSEIQNIKDFLTPQLSDLCSLCKCARYSRKGSAKMILTTISSDFTRLATHRYAGSVFWISPFTRCYVLKLSGSFSISSFCLLGGFGSMAEEKELPSRDEKKNSSGIFLPRSWLNFLDTPLLEALVFNPSSNSPCCVIIYLHHHLVPHHHAKRGPMIVDSDISGSNPKF